jgi:hypothetical protein
MLREPYARTWRARTCAGWSRLGRRCCPTRACCRCSGRGTRATPTCSPPSSTTTRGRLAGDSYVRKPLFSREERTWSWSAGVAQPVLDQGYGAEGWDPARPVALPPEFDGRRPVVGAWMVGNEPRAWACARTTGPVTKNLARFVRTSSRLRGGRRRPPPAGAVRRR